MTETKLHWRKQAALDEAERWAEMNKGWDADPALSLNHTPAGCSSKLQVKGKLPVVRVTQAQNGHEGAGRPWWRTDSKTGTDNCQGLTPWVGDWPSLPDGTRPALESTDLKAAEKRAEWDSLMPRMVCGPDGRMPSSGLRHGRETLSHKQMAQRKGQEERRNQPAPLERLRPLPTLKTPAQAVKRQPWLATGPRSWTLQDGLKRQARLDRLAALAAEENAAWAATGVKPSWLAKHRENVKKGATRQELRLQKALADCSVQWTKDQLNKVANQCSGHLRALSLEKTQELVGDSWEEELPAATMTDKQQALAKWVEERLTAGQAKALLQNSVSPTQKQTLLSRVRTKHLATQELQSWVEERLTAKQLNALLVTGERALSATEREHRDRARTKLQQLPGRLRLRR